MNTTHKKYAYVTIHFGSNPVYLELELYFFYMLRKYTKHDIIYMYSSNDTPQSFADAVDKLVMPSGQPVVTKVIPFDDTGITYNVNFKSGYSNFNTLRTCDFIFAYTLTQYQKLCIIESDMVLMRSIDSIFNLRAPAILTYHQQPRRYNSHDRFTNDPPVVLQACRDMGRLNGGVMIIEPSMDLFEKYKNSIPIIAKNNCKYPNESLFEYVNQVHYNLPVQYNLSHYHTRHLEKYGMQPQDVAVYHFNETKYKHLDMLKTPMDEEGNNWLEIIKTNPKYSIKKLPIFHYMNTVYKPFQRIVEPIIKQIQENKEKPKEKQKEKEESKEAPIVMTIKEPQKSIEKEELKEAPIVMTIEEPPLNEEIKKKKDLKRCPKGTRRNKKTGLCEPTTYVGKKSSSTKTIRKRCPNGTRRNKKTGLCE